MRQVEEESVKINYTCSMTYNVHRLSLMTFLFYHTCV